MNGVDPGDLTMTICHRCGKLTSEHAVWCRTLKGLGSIPPPTATMPAAHALFEEAERTISGPRRASYGDVAESFTRVARAWSDILKAPVSPSQVALMMIAFKVSREANAHKHDNVVDIVGYAGLLAELEAHAGGGEPQ